MTTPEEAKEAIHQHIINHQQVIMMGGIAPSSKLLYTFIGQQDEILDMFALPHTSSNRNAMFKYPFSCSINRKRLPQEVLTEKIWIKLLAECTFFGGVCIGFIGGDVKFGSYNDKVEFIYQNLARRAQQHLKS